LQGPKRARRSDKIDVDWQEQSDSEDSDGGARRGRQATAEEREAEAVAAAAARETPEEKRVRMARELLSKLQSALPGMGGVEEEEADGDEPALDPVSRELHQGLLRDEGRLRRSVVRALDPSQVSSTVCSRAHRFSLTCIALSDAEDVCFTGSKDMTVLKWDVETGKKLGALRAGSDSGKSAHLDHVLALALSSDGRYLASGGRDRLVRVWDVRADTLVDTFQGHLDAVSCLAFRRGTHTLFSGSHDRSVRQWSVDEMAYVDSLYGHQAEINGLDCLYRERAVTCSMDRTVRFWKVPEESQLLLQGQHEASIDAVKMLDEVHFVSGGQDGNLALWHTSKKRPCAMLRGVHGGKWISALAALANSEVLASGSWDGAVRLWRADLASRSLDPQPLGRLELPGFCNGLAFGKSGQVLAVAGGQEHRLGRWYKEELGSNRLTLFRIPDLLSAERAAESDDAQDEADDRHAAAAGFGGDRDDFAYENGDRALAEGPARKGAGRKLQAAPTPASLDDARRRPNPKPAAAKAKLPRPVHAIHKSKGGGEADGAPRGKPGKGKPVAKVGKKRS
jgi:ribosomal RNA-processing protein 9